MKKPIGKNIAIFTLLALNATAAAVITMSWSKIRPAADVPKAVVEHPAAAARKAPARALIQGAVRARTSELQECYNSYLEKEPAIAEGAVKIDWHIDPSGVVSSAQIIQTDIDDNEMLDCVLDHVRSWTFESPGDEAMVVAHKFTFRQRSPASLEFE